MPSSLICGFASPSNEYRTLETDAGVVLGFVAESIRRLASRSFSEWQLLRPLSEFRQTWSVAICWPPSSIISLVDFDSPLTENRAENRMKIKIYASVKADAPMPGPYKMLDIVERETPYQVGDITHYGEVILLMPPDVLNDGVEQGVVVKFYPASLGWSCMESVMEKPPTSYDKIQFTPINENALGLGEPRLAGPYQILASENLTIENLSHLITEKTFSLWKTECNISKRTSESLEAVTFAIVHRRPSSSPSDDGLLSPSFSLIDHASLCLALIRPTRKSRVMHIRGVIKADGTFDPQGFNIQEDLADVPEIQKIFGVREDDIGLLISVLPEFIQLYRTGKLDTSSGGLQSRHSTVAMRMLRWRGFMRSSETKIF
jgi:hypothetical protein